MKKILLAIFAVGSLSVYSCEWSKAISQVEDTINSPNQNAVSISDVTIIPGSDEQGNVKILYSFVKQSYGDFQVKVLGYAKFANETCEEIDFTQLGEVQ